MSLDKTEKTKYEVIWQKGSYRSASAEPFGLYLKDIVKGKCLDIGCGDGTTMNLLNKDRHIHCYGVDITTDQLESKVRIYTAPAWDMPFSKDSFDFTFSTDVLEHLPPEKIAQTIYEISRITSMKTIHQIATFPMRGEHLTVQPIEWWQEQFEKFCEVPFELQERTK
jgi:ubiquinone/menaquinone biosynthesis C-methylase UbiE